MFLAVLTILFLLLGSASAATYPADDETSLKAAFLSAVDGDTIIIQNDIILTTTNIPFPNTGVITIKSSDGTAKTLYGNGTASSSFNDHYQHFVLNDLNNNNTHLIFENIVLDGDGGTGGIKILGGSPPLYADAYNITIEGVHIKNSKTTGIILSDVDVVTIDDVLVEECKGSGISVIRGLNVVISDSVLQNNVDQNRGGGVQIMGDDVGASSAVITGDTLIKNNTAPQGGGVYLSSSLNKDPPYISTLIISGNTNITENKASSYGGGIFVSSNTTISVCGNTNVSFNEAQMGGGILLSETSAKIYENSQIVHNKATGASQAAGGGIFMQTSASLDVYGNTIINNNVANESATSMSVGGAVYSGSTSTYIKIYGNAKVAENEAKNGGGIYSGTDLFVFEDANISQNSAASNGGGIYSAGNFSAFGNALINSNTADYAGGIFATSANKATKIYDSVQISNNVANYDGGGIFINNGSRHLDLQNNVTFSNNSALDGYGGAICVYFPASLITISGTNPNDCVEFSLNKATWDGGAVWISGVSQLSNTAGQKLLFTSNSAEIGYKWDETSGSLTGDMATAAPVYLSQMPNVTPSAPFTNAYNNFDISFTEGEDDIEPAVIGIYYFQDSLQATEIGYEEFNYYVGGSLTTTAISDALGTEWLNLYKPGGYNDGKLQQTLPFTVSSDTLLDVLYSEGSSGNNSSGGNGTGNATVRNPSNGSGNGGGFAGSNETGMEGFEEEEPLLPGEEVKESLCWLWIILLLILIAIAVYLYRRYRERKEEQL